eukprot:4661146-Amphidinium_carterae.2
MCQPPVEQTSPLHAQGLPNVSHLRAALEEGHKCVTHPAHVIAALADALLPRHIGTHYRWTATAWERVVHWGVFPNTSSNTSPQVQINRLLSTAGEAQSKPQAQGCHVRHIADMRVVTDLVLGISGPGKHTSQKSGFGNRHTEQHGVNEKAPRIPKG